MRYRKKFLDRGHKTVDWAIVLEIQWFTESVVYENLRGKDVLEGVPTLPPPRMNPVSMVSIYFLAC